MTPRRDPRARRLTAHEFLSQCLGREVQSVEFRWLGQWDLTGWVVLTIVRRNRDGRPSKKPFTLRLPLRMVLSRSPGSARTMTWRLLNTHWPEPIGVRPPVAPPVCEVSYERERCAINMFKDALMDAAIDGARGELEGRAA
jgi:hypothetical protein